MKFEKKLIILSGGGGAKGTLNLERNAYGTFATLNVYNVPDLYAGEYALGVKNASGAFVRKIGSPGRILSRFKIDDIDISAVHCVVFDSNTDTPVMYGTNDVKKLWGGNLMDGLRSAKVERKKDITPQALEKALPSYSERPREIADYFLDIAPSDETAYADDRVAEVNYYPGDMRITVAYSDRPADAVIDENPVDEHLRRTERPESSDKAMPWQYAKSYINRYKNELALKEAAERAAAENEKAAPAPQAAEQAFASGQDAEPPQADERIFARTETAGQISVSEQDAVSDYAEFVADGETEFETPATDINGAGEQAAIRPETAAPEQTAANRDGGFSDSRPPRADIDETGEQAVIRPETAAPEQAAANRDGGFSDSRPPRADINGASEQAAIRPESTAPEQAALNRDGGFSDSRPPRADIRNAARQNLRGSGAAKAPAAAGITRSESAFTVPPPSDFTVDDAFADGKTQAVFYERVKPQLDELFSQNPEFDALLKAMPQTKWVKVDYDGEGKYYVVGVIGDRPDYLCYGVPASFTPEPPAELDGYCQWLPLDAQSPQGKGFWLMFQDAVTGESVRKL